MNPIALFTTDSVPMVGGIARYLHEMMVATRDVASWRLYSSIPRDTFSDKSLPYPVCRIDVSRNVGSRFGDRFPPVRKWNSLLWQLSRRRAGRSQVLDGLVHAPGSLVAIGRWCPDSVHWIAACRERRIPYIVFTYGMELVSPDVARGHLDPTDLRSAERVVTISEATRRELLALGVPASRILMLMPGCSADTHSSDTGPARSRALEGLGLTQQRFVLALGRIVERKGFDLAVRAWARLAKDFPEHVLVVAGDGPHLSAVRSEASSHDVLDRVRFLGSVTEEQKAALMSACDFFVMPNRPIPGDMEGFGIVFLEAALRGKPSIGGNNGGVPDVIVDGVTGALVNTNHGEEHLTVVMRTWLEQPALVSDLGVTAKRQAQSRFAWQETTREFREWLSTRRGSSRR